MKQTKKIALSGIFTALCVVILFLGSIFQTLDLSAAAFASLVVLAAFIELGKGYAFGVYVGVSVLSLVILPYKAPALIFAAFSGVYPILKEPLNRITPMWLSYAARTACFNVFLVIFIFLSKRFFGFEEEFDGFTAVICILANVTFIVFDFALERISVYYLHKLKPMIFGKR
jgi:hypothetical protein